MLFSIFHHLESHVDVSETGGLSAVGLKPAAGEVAAPDHIVAGVEGEVDLHAVAFGGYADQGRAFPLRSCAAVVFCDHEGAVGHLGVPVGDKDCIERLGLADLGASDHDHEVRDHGIEQAQLRFCGCREIVQRTDLDELTLKEECSFLLHLTA